MTGLFLSLSPHVVILKLFNDKPEDILRLSKCRKARLLHYFAIIDFSSSSNTKIDDSDFSNRCGWHNDHGSALTTLPSLVH